MPPLTVTITIPGAVADVVELEEPRSLASLGAGIRVLDDVRDAVLIARGIHPGAPDAHYRTGLEPGPHADACIAMRDASGRIDDTRPLVAFLYLLARDHLTTGHLEELIDHVATSTGTSSYTNGWLALWARYTADKITKGTR